MLHELNVYLAGPDVFYPQAKQKLDNKILFLEKFNIIGHSPLDSGVIFEGKPKQVIADEIAHSCESAMNGCNIILANIETWHDSPSADVGTAFEMGYMSARYEQNPQEIMIVGYYPNGIPDNFATRVIDKLCNGEAIVQDDIIVDRNGYMVEDFDTMDNLMLIHAINKSGGKIFGSFEEAAENLTALWQQKQFNNNKQQSFTPGFAAHLEVMTDKNIAAHTIKSKFVMPG